MTAVVSRERARMTYFTAAAGLALLATAFVMMLAAAPVHLHAHPHGPAKPSAALLSKRVLAPSQYQNGTGPDRDRVPGPSRRRA